ncbi:MAG: hypothetical protein MI684_03210 [Chlorobiales bacterium]|nr:hypothetical protein [Chlorobiales bacterium]
MMASTSVTKKKPYLQTILFGALSLASYIVLFTHEEWVTDNFTRGGYYVVYPIVTAFWFSFIHGAFGSNLLSALGLEAKVTKKK